MKIILYIFLFLMITPADTYYVIRNFGQFYVFKNNKNVHEFSFLRRKEYLPLNEQLEVKSDFI
jgi:hypothetical protein